MALRGVSIRDSSSVTISLVIDAYDLGEIKTEDNDISEEKISPDLFVTHLT